MWIKANDTVKVIAGEDRGTTAKVLRVNRKAGKLVVEGVNRVYKHVKRSQKNPQGGRLFEGDAGRCQQRAAGLRRMRRRHPRRRAVSPQRHERALLQEVRGGKRTRLPAQGPVCHEITTRPAVAPNHGAIRGRD